MSANQLLHSSRLTIYSRIIWPKKLENGLAIRCSGMTAVEVLVSTILASMLMVAMLGILQGLNKQSQALDTRLPRLGWQSTLDNVMRRDFANSQTYVLTGNSIVLRGYAAIDQATGLATWRPGKVVYEVVPGGNRSWLVRYEASDNESSPLQTNRQLVIADVSGIRTSDNSNENGNAGVFLGGELENEASLTIKDGLRIEFWSESIGGTLYEFVFSRP